MNKNILPVKGTHDLYGQEIDKFNYVVESFYSIATKFNFKSIQTPILENQELFSRSVGEHTDIVSKEMYSFVDKNESIFGKCSNKNWHGHNYEVFVTVKGTVDVDTGYVIDMKVLSDLIKVKIIDKMDHKNLNLEVDFLKDVITSAENIVLGIYNELFDDIKKMGKHLHCVRLNETENNYVEYYG